MDDLALVYQDELIRNRRAAI